MVLHVLYSPDFFVLLFRMIDTAQGYPMSERSVAEAIAQSGVPRSEIFIITKLHPRFLGYDTTINAVEMSLRELRTEYIDLFLIHSQQCDDFLLACGEGKTWKHSGVLPPLPLSPSASPSPTSSIYPFFPPYACEESVFAKLKIYLEPSISVVVYLSFLYGQFHCQFALLSFVVV